jgi:hypothetical protein
MATSDLNPAAFASDSIGFNRPDGLKPWGEIQAETWATRETLRRVVDA